MNLKIERNEEQEKLLCPKAGYFQDANPIPLYTTIFKKTNQARILNVLIQMKNNNKSDYTINFTRKALRETIIQETEKILNKHS